MSKFAVIVTLCTLAWFFFRLVEAMSESDGKKTRGSFDSPPGGKSASGDARENSGSFRFRRNTGRNTSIQEKDISDRVRIIEEKSRSDR